MHASAQSGGRSPKSLNGSTSNQQHKFGTENVQKAKKRERGGEQGTEPTKRERHTKPVDGESISSRPEIMMKAEFSKITDKGFLVTTESVDNLVHVMQLDKNERKIDLAGRLLVANVITATEKIECLVRFVQLKGVPVFDDWLQEAHNKGKSDGSSPKEIDKGAEELLLALLRALDKLPINLNALQTCNIGKSVNHLRSHKNPEIQKKARSLVDTWKKRVDAEMALFNDGKSCFSETPHAGDGHIRNSITNAPSYACKILTNKPGSVSLSSKDSPVKGTATRESSELPLASGKEDKSTGSSQSLNNSQSSWKEDAKSSTSGSMNANKSCQKKRSTNGFSSNNHEGTLVKAGKVSCHNVDMTTSSDQGSSHRLIVRLPNPRRSPACKTNGGSVEENSLHGDTLRSNTTHVNTKLCQSSDLAAVIDEESRTADETGKSAYSSSVTKFRSKSLFSSKNVVVESSANYSEASTSSSASDDIGINLLANVAAGEISTPMASPQISPIFASNIESKSKIACDGDIALKRVHSDEVADRGSTKHDTFDKLHETNNRCSADNHSSCQIAEKTESCVVKSEDMKPIEHNCENIGQAVVKTALTDSSAATLNSKPSCGVKNQNETVVDIKLKILISEIAEAHKTKVHDENNSNENQNVPFCSNNLVASEILENKGGIKVCPASDNGKPSRITPTRESQTFAQNCGSEVKEEDKSMKPDKGVVKLDFDLNEGFSADDCNPSEQIVTPLPGMSHITVASPAKGPFTPPESLIRGNEVHGWKGSAATSAFRPAEPRKVPDMPLNNNVSRPPFEIDLNIADEMVLEEEMAPQGSTQTAGSACGVTVKSNGGGLDLDLNKADETTDNGHFLPFMPVKQSTSRSFSAIDSNMLGGFDLNNGPGLDEAGTDTNTLTQKNQYTKKSSSNVGFTHQVPSWFPSGNTYPTVTMPSFLPGDHQRLLGSVMGPHTYSPVLSSSPAMAYPPYASFPFGPAYSSSPAPHYVDSACFQPMGPHIVGPTGGVFSHYARPPYAASQGSSSSGCERSSRKWGLDLNAGPGGGVGDVVVDVKGERRGRQQVSMVSPQAFVEEQARLYHMSGGGGMKRRDREGGSSWDERYNKQPSWQ